MAGAGDWIVLSFESGASTCSLKESEDMEEERGRGTVGMVRTTDRLWRHRGWCPAQPHKLQALRGTLEVPGKGIGMLLVLTEPQCIRACNDPLQAGWAWGRYLRQRLSTVPE